VGEQVAAPPIPRPPREEEERPAANRVPCPACGALNFDFATECVRCGFPFAIVCPACNELVPTETGFCPRCGQELPLPRKMPAVREREAQVEESYRQGLEWMEKKRYQEAKVAFEEALALDPNHIEARYNLGLACARLGLREEARRHWEEVRLRQPDYPDIQKDLDSLLPPRERRRLLKERRKAEAQARKKEAPARPAGQTLLAEFERRMEEKPIPEEETGGVEVLIYVILVGLVFGVAVALGRLPPAALAPGLPSERIVAVAKQSGVIALVVVFFWILAGLLARLFSRIFRAGGRVGGYMVCAARLLMPFFLLIPPIVLSVPAVVNSLPETVRPILQQPVSLPSLGQLPPLPWLVCGGLALFWGLFAFTRGIGRVGRTALWKGFLVGMVALVLAVALVGALVYAGYTRLQDTTYLDMLGFGPGKETPTPSPTPPVTPMPTPRQTPGP
ncbi:MAG: tetratricopeptide repeat protein, partial [Chloroflexia bacterium]